MESEFTFWSLKDYITAKGGCNKFRICDCINHETKEHFKMAQFLTGEKLENGKSKFIGIALSRNLVSAGIKLTHDFIKENCKELKVTETTNKDGVASKIATMFLEGEGSLDECEW